MSDTPEQINWDNCPQWAHWWACDDDGHAYFYQDEPKPDRQQGRWSGGGLCAFHRFMPRPLNWQEELYRKGTI